jgi:ABC-2 type transport system permease protein
MAATTAVTERTSEPPRLRFVPRIRELVRTREILLNLVRRELKVKYTSSVLGAVWSLLNPVVFLAVFSFVTVALRANVPDFPVYLLSGLLAWNLFSVALSTGARSVVDNANLVKKVAFPREVLPLASIGVALVDFALQSAVLLPFIVVTGHGLRLSTIWLYPIAIAALLVLTLAVTLWIAALNVRYRDVQHLLGLALLVWFWFTPIVYPGAVVQGLLVERGVWNLFLLNPMCVIVLGFQRALYGVVAPGGEQVLPTVSAGWLAGMLSLVLAGSLVLLAGTWRLYFRLSGDFAEEL